MVIGKLSTLQPPSENSDILWFLFFHWSDLWSWFFGFIFLLARSLKMAEQQSRTRGASAAVAFFETVSEIYISKQVCTDLFSEYHVWHKINMIMFFVLVYEIHILKQVCTVTHLHICDFWTVTSFKLFATGMKIVN